MHKVDDEEPVCVKVRAAVVSGIAGACHKEIVLLNPLEFELFLYFT